MSIRTRGRGLGPPPVRSLRPTTPIRRICELRLTSTDSEGYTATVSRDLQPRTVVLTFGTKPKGLALVVGGTESQATPFSRTVIVGSRITLTAPLTQTLNGTSYRFISWSDRGARAHEIIAPSTSKTYTATYRR